MLSKFLYKNQACGQNAVVSGCGTTAGPTGRNRQCTWQPTCNKDPGQTPAVLPVSGGTGFFHENKQKSFEQNNMTERTAQLIGQQIPQFTACLCRELRGPLRSTECLCCVFVKCNISQGLKPVGITSEITSFHNVP